MSKIIKLSLLSTIICLTLAIGIVVFAQDTATVTPQDLEVKDQKLLPDSPFYFLKEWSRSIQSLLTFDQVKKAELKEKFANEKLIELQKLTEKGVKESVIEKATEKYSQEIDKIKEEVDKIKNTAKENPKAESFLDKFTKQQLLHQEILQKLENQVPVQVLEKIKEAREKHLEKFFDVMQKLEDKTKIVTRIEKKVSEQVKGDFKEFEAMEIFKNLKEKAPEALKDSLNKMEENNLRKLENKVKSLSTEKQEQLNEYINELSGDKEKQLEILENLRTELSDKPAIQEKLKEVREKIIEKVREREATKNCPAVEKPSSDFCEKGRIVVKKDEKGCVAAFQCVVTENILGKPCQTDADCGNPNPATPQAGESIIQYRCVQNKCALQL